MTIESVKLLRSIKIGKKIWMEGVELKQPLPPEILEEIRLGNPNIQINGEPDPRASKVHYDLVSVPTFKSRESTRTTFEVFEEDPTGGVIIKKFDTIPEPPPAPKKKLIKRKKPVLIKRKKR